MAGTLPFLISVPHCGIMVPGEVQGRLALSSHDILYYSDPCTAAIYDFTLEVTSVTRGLVSRIIVDLNRPPYHLPPKHPDGAIKAVTVDGTAIYRGGWYPDMTLMHRLMMKYYFPYHAGLDQILGQGDVVLALDCHSMLPVGPPGQRDAGKKDLLSVLGIMVTALATLNPASFQRVLHR